MKASKQCPKCHSLKVGYLEQVYEFCEAPSSSGHPFTAFSVGVLELAKDGTNREIRAGHLEAFLCAECGYYETYVKDPASIPFEHLKGFHWLNPSTDPRRPYR